MYKNSIFALKQYTLVLFVMVFMTLTAQAENVTFKDGSYIIDVGQKPQTYNTTLKAYGLVYELVTNKIPVYWAIRSNKDLAFDNTVAEDDPNYGDYEANSKDFTYNGKDYYGGPFIIPAVYADLALPIIANWESGNPVDSTRNVVVDLAASGSFTVEVDGRITAMPNIVINNNKSEIVVDAFFRASRADIPDTAYRIPEDEGPLTLTTCDDLFLVPHADPHLWDPDERDKFERFINNGGYLWADCHAVGAFEAGDGVDDPAPDSTPGAGYQFLSDGGQAWYNDISNYNTLAYDYSGVRGDSRFMQTTDSLDHNGTSSALNSGSQMIYVLETGSIWRPTTRIITDPTNTNVDTNGGAWPAPAVTVAYGPAYGIGPSQVAYLTSHNFQDGTETENVAAGRFVGNVLFAAGIEHAPLFSDPLIPDKMKPGTTYTMGISVKKSDSVEDNGSSRDFTYEFESDCGGSYDPATGTAVQTDANPVAISTQFTTPSGDQQCKLIITITDACGRTVFERTEITLSNTPLAYENSYTGRVNNDITGNIITDEVSSTDASVDWDPDATELTIDANTQPSHGDLTLNADGTFIYTPTANYAGPDFFTYSVKNTANATSNTVTVTLNVYGDPVAWPDIESTPYGTPINANVITNDEGFDIVVVSTDDSPDNGTLSSDINPDGTYTYTPNPGFSGTDTFTYTIKDGNDLTSSTTVTITVGERQVVIDSTLVAEYRLDECGYDGDNGLIGDVRDNSINLLNGKTVNNVSKTDTGNKLCTGADFDGQDDYIEVAHDAKFDISDNTMTVSFWIHIDTLPANNKRAPLVYKGAQDRKKGWGFYIKGKNNSNDSELTFFYGIGNGEKNVKITYSDLGASADGWHHITGVKTATQMLLYVGGSWKKTENHSDNMENSTEHLYMGYKDATKPNEGVYFDGKLDEVKIWNRAFDEDEVSLLVSNEVAGDNWNGDPRVCNICTCTAPAEKISLVSFAPDFRNMLDDTKDVHLILGDYFGTYGESGSTSHDWRVWNRIYDVQDGPDGSNKADYHLLPEIGEDMEFGGAHWLKNYTASDIEYECNLKTMDYNATIDLDDPDGPYNSCRSANGKCVLIDLVSPNGTEGNVNVSGDDPGPFIYTMTSFPISKTINWRDVRVLITDIATGVRTAYTPSAAQDLDRIFNATIWSYEHNGTNYASVAPDTLGTASTIKPCKGYWIELDKNAHGKLVQLLVPQE